MEGTYMILAAPKASKYQSGTYINPKGFPADNYMDPMNTLNLWQQPDTFLKGILEWIGALGHHGLLFGGRNSRNTHTHNVELFMEPTPVSKGQAIGIDVQIVDCCAERVLPSSICGLSGSNTHDHGPGQNAIFVTGFRSGILKCCPSTV